MQAQIARNSPCTCGSGRRYKECCGALGSAKPAAWPPQSASSPLASAMFSALAAQRAGNLETAESLYRKALALDPDNIDALHMLGVVYFSQKSLYQAECYIRRALVLCPASSPALKNIGHNLQMLKEAQAAPGAPARRSRSLRIVRESRLEDVACAVHELCPSEDILLSDVDYRPDVASLPAGTVFPFPALRAFELADAVVDPESQLPTTGTAVVFPDFVDFSRHQLMELRFQDYTVGEPYERAVHRESWRDPWAGELPEGIIMTSGYWVNWAHFLTEVLPRIVLADAHEPWRRTPLVVSAMGLANAHELCRRLIASDRAIIRACGSLQVGRARYVTSPGWLPYEYLYDAAVATPSFRREDIAFSPQALGLVRRAACRLIGADDVRRGTRRYYLRRNSRMRQTINAEAIEARFVRHGFAVVSADALSVDDQIRLFSDAEAIAGPTGAAVANMVFAPPGCRVLVHAAYTPHWNFGYWPAMARALGHRLHYLFGEQVGVPIHPAHPDSMIDVDGIDPAVDRLLST